MSNEIITGAEGGDVNRPLLLAPLSVDGEGFTLKVLPEGELKGVR